jgi:NADPH-dependent 2,4-dienoyl-CoA reductase/sulfur reductase-like enzyme
VVARTDLDAIMRRVEPDAVVSRVDIEVSRVVDIEAVLDRLAFASIARQVIDAIDCRGSFASRRVRCRSRP